MIPMDRLLVAMSMKRSGFEVGYNEKQSARSVANAITSSDCLIISSDCLIIASDCLIIASDCLIISSDCLGYNEKQSARSVANAITTWCDVEPMHAKLQGTPSGTFLVKHRPR